MNTVLIISDSHGLKEELVEIKERHQPNYMIHCGDSELDIDAEELEGFYKVRGNCDTDNRFPDELVLELEGLTFLVVHGHLHHVKRDYTTLSYAAEEAGAIVVCFGHTHVAGALKVKEKLYINPGSILNPRSIPDKTYALLQWENLEEIHVTFYNIKGDPCEMLNYKTSL